MSGALDPAMRAQALVLAGLLQASVRVLGVWSLLLSLLAAVQLANALAWGWSFSLAGCSLVLGGAERYLSFRLSLDQWLFARLGRAELAGLEVLDQALARLGLRAQAAQPRPWPDRLRGTQRLLRLHAAVVLLQTAALLTSVFLRS